MSREHGYAVTVGWVDEGGTATYRGYTRAHDVVAAGKPVIRASADPAFRGDPALWNPEELLVASLAQCHMLTYLALCARNGVVVTEYTDDATATMQEVGAGGRFTDVLLRPAVTVADASMVEKAGALHHQAHEDCFIASSVNFPVRHQPTVAVR